MLKLIPQSNNYSRISLLIALIFLIGLSVLPIGLTKQTNNSFSTNSTKDEERAGSSAPKNNPVSAIRPRDNNKTPTQTTKLSVKDYLSSDSNHANSQITTSVFSPDPLISSPFISSISPSTPTPSGSNQSVSVFGSGFISGLTVTVFYPGGSSTLSGTQIQSVSSSSFTMIITLGLVGQYSIRVNNPDGGQSNTFSFSVQNPTPQINSISPSSPTRRDTDQNVTVFGSNFQSGLTVTVTIPGFGTSTLSGSQIQSVSSNSFIMIIKLNVVGTYGIRVNNPNGTQSNTFNFSVQNAVSTPQINSISPSTPTISSANQNVSVFGSGFQSGLTVTVFYPGGSSTLSGTQIQSVSSTSFTMVITLNIVGSYGIRVNNPDGGQSSTFNFSTRAQSPQINSISPSTPTRRDTDQSVSVSGSGFQSGLTITVFYPGGSSTLSGSQIQNVTSSSFTMLITLNITGSYGIRVNNPDGGQSNTFNFNVQNPISTPQISSISPSNPTAKNSDQSVSVSGSGFQSGLTITVFYPGGSSTLSGTQIQSVTSTSFTMLITLSITGTYGIRVNNPDGGQSNTFNFSVQNPISTPQIGSISPSSPTVSNSDQNVVVSGSGFQQGLTVTVFYPGGSSTLSGAQIQSVSSTSFTMIVTLNLVGAYGIRVNNPDGGQSSTFNFSTRAQNPQINSISPVSPTRRDSDQNVTVTGSGFNSGLTVTVFIPGGGTATLSGAQIQNVTSNSFTMIVTLNLIGQYGIRVNNIDGGQSTTFFFQVQNSVITPQINSIFPSSPTRRDTDQSITVSGTGFQAGLTVTVFYPGGSSTLSGSQIQNVSLTSFTMLITVNLTGTYSIRVNNQDGGQSNIFNFQVQNPVSAPQINSVTPAAPTRKDGDQTITVSGSGFQNGLTVTVFIPGVTPITLSGAQIQNVSSTSFTVLVTLNLVGQYGIRVNNLDGVQSNTFNFQVQSAPPLGTAPSLFPRLYPTEPGLRRARVLQRPGLSGTMARLRGMRPTA